MASSPSAESCLQLPTSPQQLGTPEDKELPAPAGWQKKIASTKSGGTPRRGAVYFIAPGGEEIKSKRSLEGYLKSHPGGPSVTEFDWSTGETPRRSSRLSTKTPHDSPESGSGRRRVRRKVAVEDDSPQDEERVGVDGALLSARADEVMADVEKDKECEAVEKMEYVINDEVKKTIEKTEVEKNSQKTDEHKIVESVSKSVTEEEMESDINEEMEKVNEKTDERKIVECVSIGEVVQKMEADHIIEEVEKIAEKTDEHKIAQFVSEAETAEVEKREGKEADAVLPCDIGLEEEPVKQDGGENEGKSKKLQSTMEEADHIIEEVEKIAEKTDKHKIVQFVLEAETAEVEKREGKEAGAELPRQHGPEEELVRQEVGEEKVQTDEGKTEKSQSKMEETPGVEVREVVQGDDEKATNNEKIGTFEEEHKQEDSENTCNGVSQLSGSPEAL